MLDFSWSEFLVVLVVAVLAIGPKQLPDVLYGLGRMVRRFQYFRFAVGKQFDTFMEQADLNEIRKSAPMISLHELDEKAHDDDHHGAQDGFSSPSLPGSSGQSMDSPNTSGNDEKGTSL